MLSLDVFCHHPRPQAPTSHAPAAICVPQLPFVCPGCHLCALAAICVPWLPFVCPGCHLYALAVYLASIGQLVAVSHPQETY